MISAIPLWLVVAQSLSAPVPQADPQQQRAIRQIVRTDASGKVTTETRPAEPAAATARAVQPDGTIIESAAPAERRVLIELRERPSRDAKKPGSPGERGRQRAQLARDLAGIDTRLRTRVPAHVRRHFDDLFSGVAATVDPAAVEEIRRLPYVLAVHEDTRVRAHLAQSVPMIGALAVASTYGVTGTGVTVAVIDTGIDYTHPDLGGCFGSGCRVKGGWDFVNDDADPRDDHGHGTHVAGIVGANGVVRGVAPGVKLLAYKVLDDSGYGYDSDIIAGIERAVTDGAKIANLSLGGPGAPDGPSAQAVDNATAAGMLSVIAAGNSGSGYRSVNSPGVARTALTVGAVDKTGEMAWFSSRGFVADGDAFLMKPEITAPGVAINSTVPATGYLGHASRYAAYDGTSMAAPHVAGAAALLLQWKPAQTPADLKHRLVASGTTTWQDAFTEGNGLVSLTRAFELPFLPLATHVDLGLAAGNSGVTQLEKTISIRNPTGAAHTVSLGVGTPFLPAGAVMTIVPSSLTLQAGQTASVTVKLQVDKAVTPTPPDPLAWHTNLTMSSEGQTATMPVYFFRGSVINLSFDQAPWYVYLANPTQGILRAFERPGTTFSTILQDGTWDVLALYDGEPRTFVVREQQNLQGELSLSLQRSEATRKIVVRGVDEQEQPLRFGFNTDVALGLRPTANTDWVNIVISASSWGEFRSSPLSARYAVGVLGAGADTTGKKFYSYSWTGSGLASDVALPVIGAPMRKLVQSGTRPPGAARAVLTHLLGFAFRYAPQYGLAILFGSAYPEELDWTVYLQWAPAPGLPLMMSQSPWFFAATEDWTITDYWEGTYLRHTGGPDVLVDQTPFFDVAEPARQPDAVLGPAVTRWDVTTQPSSLPLKFANTPSGLYSWGRTPPYWVTHTASRQTAAGGTSPTFTLYRNGTLAGTHRIYDLSYPIPTTPGPHEVHASLPYRIGDVQGSSKAVFSFDTSNSDPNPPWVTGFRIEQKGQRTPMPVTPSVALDTSVRFNVTDEIGVATVVLEWRQHNGNGWTALPLSVTGSDYSAPFQLEGKVDLRLTVTDVAGNSVQEEWKPAVVTAGSAPPSAPSSVNALRSGGSISISWSPSNSAAGIARYRVERLPGGQTFETNGPVTTFLDSNGLVSGNAYFYRVRAIDQNGVQSAPSAYDGASLISFQDDPALPGARIRGVHVGELRLAIDKVRNAVGLAPAWTSYGPATGLVKAADFLQLRDGLNAARAAIGVPPVEFSIPLSAGTRIRAAQVQQLRDSVE